MLGCHAPDPENVVRDDGDFAARGTHVDECIVGPHRQSPLRDLRVEHKSGARRARNIEHLHPRIAAGEEEQSALRVHIPHFGRASTKIVAGINQTEHDGKIAGGEVDHRCPSAFGAGHIGEIADQLHRHRTRRKIDRPGHREPVAFEIPHHQAVTAITTFGMEQMGAGQPDHIDTAGHGNRPVPLIPFERRKHVEVEAGIGAGDHEPAIGNNCPDLGARGGNRIDLVQFRRFVAVVAGHSVPVSDKHKLGGRIEVHRTAGVALLRLAERRDIEQVADIDVLEESPSLLVARERDQEIGPQLDSLDRRETEFAARRQCRHRVGDGTRECRAAPPDFDHHIDRTVVAGRHDEAEPT